MSRTKVVLIGFLALLLIALPLLGACGEKEVVKEVVKEVPVEKIVEKEVIKEVPVKPEFKGEIHVAYLPWVTGPAAEYNPITWGFLDYFHDVNDRGGINGAKVMVHWVDTAYDTAKVVAGYSRFTKEFPVVAVCVAPTGGHLALMPRYEEDKIPGIGTGGTAVEVWPVKPWVFGFLPTYGDLARALMKYALEQWKGPEPPKVGIAYSPNPYGESCIKPLEKYGEEKGYTVVTKQELPFGALDATSQALALKKAGANVVFIQSSMASNGVLCRDMERQGLKPKMMLSSPQSIDAAIHGIAKGADEGLIAASWFLVWPQDLDNPAVKYWRDKAVEYNSGGIKSADDPYNSMWYFLGVQWATIPHAGIAEAVKKVGVEKLTGEAVRDGLERATGWTVPPFGSENIVPPLAISPDDHRSYHSTGLMQVKNGEWVRLVNWIECPPVPDWEKTGGK